MREPTWWIVFAREFTDLWVGGKGLTFILVYSIVLGMWSYVMASNTDLKLIPPKEMVWEMLEATLSLGSFICIVAAAESISGDRERGALEALLLTPTSRRQIVMGKFGAMLSLWPAALAVTIPYIAVLSQGTDILGPASLWGIITGTIMVGAITALGMIISLWSNNLKTSMFASLGMFIFIFMPFALPGHASTGPMGLLMQMLSPLMATYNFLAKILVNNRSLADYAIGSSGIRVWHHMITPVAFFVTMVTLLWVVSPGLRIEAGKGGGLRALLGRASALLALFGLLGLGGTPASAEEVAKSPTAVVDFGRDLEISIDRHHSIMPQGDSLIYKTIVTNHGATASPPLTLAMNIINLNAKGDVVDPEDWSPQRTQYVDQIPAGESATMNWKINSIMDGDYMLYMVVIPKPDRPEATSIVATSLGIHLTITPRVKLNPKGIAFYVVGTPILLLFGMVFLYRRRKRATEGMASAD